MSTTALNGINPNQLYQFNVQDILGGIVNPKKDDSSENTSIWNFKKPSLGCDLPENGGITGNLGKDDKPIPGACEERPVIIDPKTGEKVYLDEYMKENMPSFISYEA